jgi:hypothetical protein
MAAFEDDMIVKTVDLFVTKNTLNPRKTPDEIAAFLRAEEAGGQLTTTVTSGGVREYLLVQTRVLDEKESEDVRLLLEMDEDEEEEADEDEDEEPAE